MKNDLTLPDAHLKWLEYYMEQMYQHQITQTELAKLLGITRPYLNMLLLGKRHLTVDMRQRMMIALRELSGGEILTMCLDYVRIRFPTHDPQTVMTQVVQIKPLHFAFDSYGLYGYKGKFQFGDCIEIFVSEPDDNRGTLLELKGKGCRLLESFLKAQGRDWYQFFLDALALAGVMKRIDIAINDYLDILSVPYFTDKCLKQEYISKFREVRHFDRRRSGITGQTLYFGSRKSAIYFCFYQKDKEQLFKFDTPIDETAIKNRFEIRLADERAEVAVENLLSERDANKVVFGIINQYLRFLKPVPSKDKVSWPLDDRWETFIGRYRERLALTMMPEPLTLDQTVNWVTKQVAPTLKMLRTIDSAIGEDRLTAIIDHAKLSNKQLTMIEQTLSTTDNLIIKPDEISET